MKRIELKLRSDCQFCAFHVAKCTAIIIVGSARNLKLLQEIIVNESSFYFSVVTFILCLLILYIVLYLSINFNIKKINESLTHYYKDRAVKIYRKALKIKILHKVALGLAFRENVCLQNGKNGNTPKFPSMEIVIMSSTVMLL